MVGGDDAVVLCTGGRTFDVKCAETSNTVLLVPVDICAAPVPAAAPGSPSADDPADDTRPKLIHAVGSTQRTYTLLDAAPRINQLEALLEEHVYSPTHNDDAGGVIDSAALGVSLATMDARVQASREEIMAGLDKLGAATMPTAGDGVRYWCKIDPDYVDKVRE